MPAPIVRVGDPRVLALIGLSVAPVTWRGHGKAWDKWCLLAGDWRDIADRVVVLGVS